MPVLHSPERSPATASPPAVQPTPTRSAPSPGWRTATVLGSPAPAERPRRTGATSSRQSGTREPPRLTSRRRASSLVTPATVTVASLPAVVVSRLPDRPRVSGKNSGHAVHPLGFGGPAVMIRGGSWRAWCHTLRRRLVGLQMRCRECTAEVAATARVYSRCGAPIVGEQPPVVTDTVVGAVSDAAGKV